MKTRFKTSTEENKVERLLKNKNFRNNQNYIISNNTRRKALNQAYHGYTFKKVGKHSIIEKYYMQDIFTTEHIKDTLEKWKIWFIKDFNKKWEIYYWKKYIYTSIIIWILFLWPSYLLQSIYDFISLSIIFFLVFSGIIYFHCKLLNLKDYWFDGHIIFKTSSSSKYIYFNKYK